MRIERVTDETFEAVLGVVAEYQAFYEATPDAERNRAHFGGFLENPSEGVQFVALTEERQPIGFATLYFPYSSVSAGKQCVMNDLYVSPEARGRGVGLALIKHCQNYAREHEYLELSWETRQANEQAQRLYARTGAERTAWYVYTLPVANNHKSGI